MDIPLPSPTTTPSPPSPPPLTTGVGSSSSLVDWYQNLSQHLDNISLDIHQLQLDHQEDMHTLIEEQDRCFRKLLA